MESNLDRAFKELERYNKWDGEDMGECAYKALPHLLAHIRYLEVRILQHFFINNQKLDSIMADLSKLQDAVSQEDTVIDSAITLIQGLADEIKNLPAGDQDAIDALAADVQAKAQALAEAVAANTPSTTTTTVAA